MPLSKLNFLWILLLFLCFKSYAGTIKGYVSDKKSGEQIVGAIVVVEGTKLGTVTSLDGKFIISDVPEGNYKLKIQYIAYEPWEQDIVVAKDQVISVKAALSEKASTLKEVQITGKYNRGSDEEAQNKERYGHEIMNIVSARSIEISPDITVASVLQRVSGVSIESSPSGKQYAIIRGMDKKYNTTLINGIKIPSPNDKDRYIPTDIFPAELLERLDVIKTLSPSMEGDAAGGVINLEMKNAPDKLMLNVNLGAGYSSIFQHQDFLSYSTATINKRSPSEIYGAGYYATQANFPYQNLVTNPIAAPINSVYGLTVGNRFLKNKLGIVVSGSFQNNYEGYKSISFVESPTYQASINKNTLMDQHFSDLNYREFSTLSQRLGTMSKIDYQFNDKNSLSLFGTYVQLNQFRTRFTVDSSFGGWSDQAGYVGYNAIHHRYETRSTLQNIANATLQGKHKLTDNFMADWSLVASQAKQQIPDDAQFSYSQSVSPGAGGTFSLGTPVVSGEDRNWYRNTDQDLAGYLNFHYSPSFIKNLKMIDFGGLYRHKDRNNYANAYSLSPVDDPGSVQENYASIQNAKFLFTPSNLALGTLNNPGIYTYTENITAGYVQLDYNLTARINLFGGVRVENTNGGYVCSLPVTIAGKTASYVYTDFLPSIQGKYALTEKSALRASYFRSIYRPAFGDLIPYPNPMDYEDYDFAGNPYLQHTVIDNMDVRYELFPKGLDQFMIGAFNKIINDPIEYAATQPNKSANLNITPETYGTAHNYGVELVFRKYFGSFGIAGNYTYTNSSITTAKRIEYHDTTYTNGVPNSFIKPDTINQARPLTGQAAHIGNLSLLYKDTRHKIDAQLAFVYTGEAIRFLSPFYKLDIWQKPTYSIDFSADKQFGKHFTVYVKIKNLFNSGYELFIKEHNAGYSGDSKLRYQDGPNYITVEKDFFKASYLFGVKYKL